MTDPTPTAPPASEITANLRTRHECTAGFTRAIYRPEDRDLDLVAADAIESLQRELDEANRDVGRYHWMRGAMLTGTEASAPVPREKGEGLQCTSGCEKPICGQFTEQDDGEGRIDTYCANCGHTSECHEHIPPSGDAAAKGE